LQGAQHPGEASQDLHANGEDVQEGQADIAETPTTAQDVASQGQAGAASKHEPLFPDTMAIGPWDFLSPTRLFGISALGLLAGFNPIAAISITFMPSDEVVVLRSVHAGVNTFMMYSLASFCLFCVAKGDKHNWGCLFCSAVAGISYFTECITIARESGTVISPTLSGAVTLMVLSVCPGRRNCFGAVTGVCFYFSILPFVLCRIFLPTLFCLADGVNPLISSLIYPILLSMYECLYLPAIFYMWNIRSRRDCPGLGLTCQLALFNAFSEALFFGGLVQMAHRYSEAQLLRFGPAAERSFEGVIQEATVTDNCHSVFGWTPEDIVCVAVVIFAFSTGPFYQALSLMYGAATTCQ